jgi:flagellin FlaB
MFDNDKHDSERGQVGIGTLIVFIAMVLVAAIAAGVLINTAGFLQSQSEETGQQSSQQVTNRLQVQTATGLVSNLDGENSVGAVELIATKAPGAEDIDLTGVTVQWVDDTGTYDIVHDKVWDGQDGAFDHLAVKDQDDSLDDASSAPVINNPDDRARLLFDINQDDTQSNGVFYDGGVITQGDSDELWNGNPDRTDTYSGGSHTFRNSAIPEGSNAQLRITTQSGATSTVRLTVPTSLSGKSAASL